MALAEIVVGRLQNTREDIIKKIDYIKGYSPEEKDRIRRIIRGEISGEDVRSYRDEVHYSRLMPWNNLSKISLYYSAATNSDLFLTEVNKEIEREDNRWEQLKPEERTLEMQAYYLKKGKGMGIKPSA